MKQISRVLVSKARVASRSGDRKAAAKHYNHALKAAEAAFGRLHGEVGIVLIAMVEFYEQDENKQAKIILPQLKKHMHDIAALYILDQET